MPINADSVTVELIAKTDGYAAKVNDAARQTEAAMGKVSGSVGRAENVINMSAARIANGQRNLGRQFADVGASLSSGSSPFVVLAQQLPQIADALTDTGGKAARFASILTGPVGAAGLAVASILATTLLPKLLETGDGVDDLVKRLEDNARKAELSAQASTIFANSQVGLASRVRDATKALADQNATLRTNAQLQNVRRQQDNIAAQAGVAKANADLKAARLAITQQSQIVGAGGSGGENTRAREALVASQKALADAQRTAQEANRNLNVSRVFLAADNALANSTTQGKIARQYDDRINALQRVAVREANAGKQIGAATQQRIEQLQREKAAALETVSARERVTGGGRTRSAGVGRVRSRAMSSTSDISFNFDASYINSDKEFNKLVEDAGDAARRAQQQFRDIFGREGTDYEGPFGSVDDYNRQQEVNARVRDEARRKDENQIRDLANFYENAFSGGADGIWKQFKREGLQAIALVLAKLTLGKSLGQALGSLGGEGGNGGIIGTIASVFGGGRASGGDVQAGKIYKINENGPELFQPAQSGKIYPTGSLAAKAGGGRVNTTVVSAPQFNLRGAVITTELYRDMETISRRNAAQAGKLAVEASPGRVQQFQTLGT